MGIVTDSCFNLTKYKGKKQIKEMIMKNSKAIVLVSAACAFFVMCSSSPAVLISSADNQKEIKAKTGEIIELTIETQPSTGYSWQIASLSCVEKYGESKIDAGTDVRRMGRVETEHIFFKAVKAGSGYIDLKYVRPWEKDDKPAKSYKVSVIVTDK